MKCINKIIISITISILLSCTVKKDTFELPLNKTTIWYYDVKGYMSAERYMPARPETLDSLRTEAYSMKQIPERDTIKVYVKDITQLNKDSTLFKLSEDFVRFWGTTIIKTQYGYYYYWEGDYNQKYILRNPVKVGNRWTNRLKHEYDDCEITNIDTTIKVAEQYFQNCIEVTINRIGQVSSHQIKMYLSEEFGLVYYKDYGSLDEIKLLKMERLRQ